MKTLYVSDLDGTLLRGDQTLSPFAKRELEKMIDKGMIFTYATARSVSTARVATDGLSVPFAVVYNGAFTVDMKSGEKLLCAAFEKRESDYLICSLLEGGISPRVFALIDGEERFTYTPAHLDSLGAREYFRTRKNDPRARLGKDSDLFVGEIFTISACGKKEELLPLYEKLSGLCICHFYPDNYSPDYYLEFLPKGATKAMSVLRLKEHLGCDRIVAFGDGINDISMFEVADECYAVEGAHPDLKRIATGIIPSNEEDGVVRWLLENEETRSQL